MSETAAARPAPEFSRGAWILLGIVFALCFLQFWVRTTPVRLANTDDVVFQQLADQGGTARFTAENALSQGRFYYATPPFGPALSSLYAVRSPWLFSLLRAAAFFAQVGLAAWLLARVSGRPVWGAALALLIVATLHIPLTFYPLLSYPFDWLGFAAVLAGLHFHQSHLERARVWTGALAGACFLLGCLMHEVFVLFFPLFPALSWVRRSRHWFRETLAPFVAVTGYVTVYFAFARLHPSTYSGTQLVFNLPAAGQVLARQMIGIVPGFELLVRRPSGLGFEPLLRDWAEIGRNLLETPWLDLGLALVKAGALTALLVRCSRSVPPLARAWPWLLAFAVALNLPVAFSAKYQVFLMQRTFPYAYAFYSFFFTAAGVVCLVALAGQWPYFQGRAVVFAGILGLVLSGICWSASAANIHSLQVLVRLYN